LFLLDLETSLEEKKEKREKRGLELHEGVMELALLENLVGRRL
jgi:hypothetical protein